MGAGKSQGAHQDIAIPWGYVLSIAVDHIKVLLMIMINGKDHDKRWGKAFFRFMYILRILSKWKSTLESNLKLLLDSSPDFSPEWLGLLKK